MTPTVAPDAVTFSGDLESDQLDLSVNPVTEELRYRSDSAAPWTDLPTILPTITPGMTATQIIVDLAGGDDTLSIDAALVKALSSQTDNDFRYLGGGNTDTIFVSVDNDDSFVLTTTNLTVRDSEWLLSEIEVANLTGSDEDNRFTIGPWTGSVNLTGQLGADTYEFVDAWGTAAIIDSEGAIDLASLNPALSVRVDGVDPERIEAVDSNETVVGTVNVPDGVSSGLTAFRVGNAKSNFDNGLAKLRDVIGDVSLSGLLEQTNRFLGDASGSINQALASFVRLDQSVDDFLVSKIAALGSDVTIDALANAISVSNQSLGGRRVKKVERAF
ncbi:MAG: hypothetical protein P1U77_12570 [Rubripirellula sp.]|nr:hypothetical protein [Rubripirellula sp.]